MSPDSIYLSSHGDTLDGLRQMLDAALGDHDYVHGYVDVPIALFIVAVAKRAEDKPEWFPHGKWATIQEIEHQINREMDRVWSQNAKATS